MRELVPDLPEEYFRLPYSAAKSDFLRYGMLYHHGGTGSGQGFSKLVSV